MFTCLSVNQSKCELFIPSDIHKDEITRVFREVAPNIKIIGEEELSLLGSPLTALASNSILAAKINTYQLLSDRLLNIQRHTALFLLRNCLAIPMMTYLIRSAPIFENILLKKLDEILKSSLEHILNASLEVENWVQATLPVSLGGIGIRQLSSLAVPAYCSSVYSTKDLVSQIFDPSINFTDRHLEKAEEIWKSIANVTDVPLNKQHQKSWDIPIAMKEAAVDKRNDYRTVCNSYHFIAFAVDCLGGWSQEAKAFGSELARRLKYCSAFLEQIHLYVVV
ncbi:hypothetical protein Bhyg_03669 [Pseudolycoriella hygida]|uniref:Uncharacterized protein n=1 Tax=Pseudolycoriella hygida TaxID=35572 RepID=A0A9Q0NF09_9DIPT|nr:hypothetical protein Bhyg_03669 [Pseudolycoriella hygida]